jgi:serine/threonine protein phosphatase 1
MKRLLSFLRGRERISGPAFDAPLAPEQPLAVIGDVHGRDDLLGRLLGRLSEEAPDHVVVLVGDLVDRGDESAQVLRRIEARPDLLCLRGNHEEMCLNFLEEPVRAGPGWLLNGGLQTLASYGVGVVGPTRPEALLGARDALRLAMGDGLIDWLRSRPLSWRSGNVVVTHAGADPLRPIADQEPRDLLWGNSRFGKVPRADGIWIVHGHRIQPEAHATDGRIAVDTGAYATGRLTAALIAPGDVRFMST